jgi:hypothetical protein
MTPFQPKKNIIWRPVKKEGSIQIQGRYGSRRRAREGKRTTAERIYKDNHDKAEP